MVFYDQEMSDSNVMVNGPPSCALCVDTKFEVGGLMNKKGACPMPSHSI